MPLTSVHCAARGWLRASPLKSYTLTLFSVIDMDIAFLFSPKCSFQEEGFMINLVFLEKGS